MLNKPYFTIFLIVPFLFVTRVSNAQPEAIALLKQQFVKELSLGFKAIQKKHEASIELQLLSESQIGKYNLADKSFDAFYIKVQPERIFIASTSLSGLKNGVAWYLQLLGFRYYFPNSLWYHIPQLSSIFHQIEKTVNPSFSHRRIWYAYGTGSKQADNDYAKWSSANLLGGEEVNVGHAYDGIVNRNKAVFLQHPEYFAQKVARGKIPANPKFEVGNESLVELVINDAFGQIESRFKRTGQLPAMISMDPSDGGGFSTSAASLKIGGPGEQTFYLANRVAKAVRQKYPSIKIGLYAYYQHAAPPSFAMESNVVVLIATAMNQSKYRTNELIELWMKKGVEVGIREYYGVLAWDWDMPGQPNGSKVAYISSLKGYHKSGIRLVSAETNIGWISRGLGHYMAARLLWDVDVNLKTIENAFFKQMFGNAENEMKQLFQAWQNYKQPVPLEGDLYQWGKLVEAATKRDNNSRVRQRIDEVKKYLHYVHLFKEWKKSSTENNLVQLLNYAYRVQDDGIVASYPLFRRLAGSLVAGKRNMKFNDPKAVWKQNNKPVSSEEINKVFFEGLNSLNQLEKIEVRDLPQQFRKRDATGIVSNKIKSSLPVRLRGRHTIIFQLDNVNSAAINLSTGLIKARQYKTLRLTVYAYTSDLNTAGKTPLLNITVAPKQPLETISLKALQPGIYTAVIDDGRNGFTMSFTGAVSYGIVAGSQNRVWTLGRNNLVFAVGTEKEFQIKNDGALTLRSPTGRVIDFQEKKGIFTIQVQKGEQGIWKVERQNGVFHIQGLLPVVNSDPDFLLHKED